MAHMQTPRLSRGMDRRMREVERAASVLGGITPHVLADLQRRREATAQADGFKSGNYGSGGESTSTESAALSGLPDDDDARDDWRRHTRPDYIGGNIEKALAKLDEATLALRACDRFLQPVLHAADAKQGRRLSIGICNACGRDVPGTSNDRLKSGYCTSVKGIDPSGCYEQWIGEGRPDRLRFEQVVKTGSALVTT